MTQSSYIAWDGNRYEWPPPDGWYEAADGQWWPEGYGPKATSADDSQPPESEQSGQPESEQSGQPESVHPEPAASQPAESVGSAGSDTNTGVTDGEPATLATGSPSAWDGPSTVGPEGASVTQTFAPIDPEATPEPAGGPSGAVVGAQGPDGGLGPGGAADGHQAALEPSAAPDPFASPAPGTGAAAAVSGGTDLFAGSGPVGYSASPYGESAPPGAEGVQPGRGFDQYAGAGDTAYAGGGHAVNPDLVDTPVPTGAGAKTLVFIAAGLLALVAVGALLFTVLRGGDTDADAAAAITGPGSFAEPHSSSNGVAVFYPDGDVNQRWVVEVVEPARDLTGSRTVDDGLIPAAARIRVRNEEGTDGAALSDLSLHAVSAAGDVYGLDDAGCPFSVDDLDLDATVPLGEAAEGDVCWSIPASDLTGLRLGVESSKVRGRVHILIG